MAVVCPHFGRRVQHGNRGAGPASGTPNRSDAPAGRPARLGFDDRQSHSWSYETTAAAATASYGGRIQHRASRSGFRCRARAHRRCKRPLSRFRDHARLSRARRDRPQQDARQGYPRTRRRDCATGTLWRNRFTLAAQAASKARIARAAARAADVAPLVDQRCR
jgi:hypothetical protein